MNQPHDPTAFQVGDYVDYEKQVFLARLITKVNGNCVQLKDPSQNHQFLQSTPIPIEKIKPFRTHTKLKENSMSAMLNFKKKIEIDQLIKHIQTLQNISNDPLQLTPKEIIQTLRGKLYFYSHHLLNNIIETEPVLEKTKTFFKLIRELFLKYLLLTDFSLFTHKNIYQTSMSALCSCYPEMIQMAQLSTGIFTRVGDYKKNNETIFKDPNLQKQMQEWVECQLLPFFVDAKYSIFPFSLKINLMTAVVNIVRKYKISTSQPLGVFFQSLYKQVLSSINDINISHSRQLHQFYQCQKFIFRVMYQSHHQKQNNNNDSSLTQKLQSEEIKHQNGHSQAKMLIESPKKQLTVDQFEKIRQLQFRSRVARAFLLKGHKQKMLMEILTCLNQVGKQFKIKQDKAHFIENWPVSTREFLQYIQKSGLIQAVLSIPKYQEYVVKIRNFIQMVYTYLPRTTLIACITTSKINLIKQIIQSKLLKEDVLQWLINYTIQLKPEPHQTKSILELLKYLQDWLKERNTFTSYHEYRVRIINQIFYLGHTQQNVQLHLFDSVLRLGENLKKSIFLLFCKDHILVNLQTLQNHFDEFLLSKYCENFEVTIEQFQNMLKPMFQKQKNLICFQRRKNSIMGVLHYLYRLYEGKPKYFVYLKIFLNYFSHPDHKNLPNHLWNNFYIQPMNPNIIEPPFSIFADQQLCSDLIAQLPPLKCELDTIIFNQLFIRKNTILGNIVMHPRKYQIAQVNQIPLHFQTLLQQFYCLQRQQIKCHQQYVFRYFFKAKETAYNQMLKLFLQIIINNQSKVREVNQIFKNLKTRYQFACLTSPIRVDNTNAISKVDYNLSFKSLTLEDTLIQNLKNYQNDPYRLTIFQQQKKGSALLQIKNSDTITIIKQKLAFKLNKEPQQIILLNKREQPLAPQYQTNIFSVCVYQFIDQNQFQRTREPGKIMTIQICYRISTQKTIIHQCLIQHAEQLFSQLPLSFSILWGIDFKTQKWGSFDPSNSIANNFQTAVKGEEIPPLFMKHTLLLNSLLDYFLWKKQQQSLRLYDFRCLLLCGKKIDTAKDIFLNLKIVYLIHASQNFQTENRQLLLNMLTFSRPDDVHLTYLDFEDTYIKLNELVYKIIESKPHNILQFCMKTKMFEKMSECDITYNNFKQYWIEKYKYSTFKQKLSIFDTLEERMVRYQFNMKQLGSLLPYQRECDLEQIDLYTKSVQKMIKCVLQINQKNKFPPPVKLTEIYLINIVQFLKKGYNHSSVQSPQFINFLISHFYDYAFNFPHIMFSLLKFAMHSKQNRLQGCAFFQKEINQKVWKTLDFLQVVRRFRQFQPKGLVGLSNNRNICFANSLFQQLYHNKAFHQELMAADWKAHQKPEFDLILQLKRIFLYLKEGRQPHLVSQFYDYAFKCYDNHPIQMYYQMDVDQFRNLLFHNLQVLLPQNKFWTKIFDGKQASIIRCLQCNNISRTEETFNSIHLSTQNVSSLQKSLTQYGNTSILQNQNAYSCDKCNKKVKAQKSIQIIELPPTLTFVLKRFQYSAQKKARKKLFNHFQFPLDQFNFAQYQYKLKGIICHIGSPQSGHYVSYIKLETQWFQFNDYRVRQITIEEMVSQTFGASKGNDKNDKISTAYLLFYQSENHPQVKNKMEIQQKIVGVQQQSARIAYQTVLMCKETFLTFHFLEFTTYLCHKHPQQNTFRLFFKTMIQISFKLRLLEDVDINQYVPHLYEAYYTIAQFQQSFSFIWQQDLLQRVMTILKSPMQVQYKAILAHLLIQNCTEQTRDAENVLNICLINIYIPKMEVFPYYFILHGLAIKHQWASEYIFQRRAVGRILDLTYYGLLDNETRQYLKHDSLLQFQSGYRVQPTIICDGMKHHKWALLCYLVSKYYTLLHPSQKKLISPLTSSMVLRLFQLCKTKADLRYLNEYLCFLIVREDNQFSNKLISTLRDGLMRERHDILRKYLRAISDIAKIQDQQQETRCRNIINIFYKAILNLNTLNGESIQYVWLWMLKMANKNEIFRSQLVANRNIFQFLTQKSYVQSPFYRCQKIHSFPKTRYPLHRVIIPQSSAQALQLHNQKIQKTKNLLNNRVYERHLNEDDSDADMADQPNINSHLYLFNQFLQTFEYFDILCVIGDVIVSKSSIFKDKQPFSRLVLKGDERLTRKNIFLQMEPRTQAVRPKEDDIDGSSMSSR